MIPSDCFFWPIVIDNGSGTCKGGFGGEEKPRAVVPAIVGRPRFPHSMPEYGRRDHYVGEDAQDRRGVLALKYPIKHGIVADWDDMEKIWDQVIYSYIHVAPEERLVLLTEPALNPKRNREMMAQIMFEKFETPGMFVALQGLLSMHYECSPGRTSAVVLDIGDGVVQSVPIFEGYPIRHAIQRVDLAGRELTDYLARLLTERGYHFSSSAEREIVRDVKEQLCYVSQDFEQELLCPGAAGLERDYVLPDGQTITIGSERFRCPEALFQPRLIGSDGPGIHELVYKTIMSLGLDLRSDMYSSVILAGGGSLFPGLAERLQQELAVLLPSNRSVKVIARPNRHLSVWLGGSILASLSSFREMWIAKEEYEEYGAAIVQKKCSHYVH